MPEQTRLDPIVIVELEDAWNRHAHSLRVRRHQIAPGHDQHNGEGSLHPEAARQVDQIDERLAAHDVDPTMTAAWHGLGMAGKPPAAGVMPSQQGEPAEDLKVGELRAAAVYWMLEQSGHADPKESGFGAELNRRRTEFDGATERYKAVAKAELTKGRRLSIRVLHDVAQRLIEEGQPANEETVKQAFEAVHRGYAHRKHGDISLGELATDATVEIVPDHLRAAAVVWSHARHDDAGVFDAVDRIVHDADLGRIAIGRRAIERIEDYRRYSTFRWLSPERVESLRDRVLGPPFPPLWRKLVVASHDFVARLTADDLVGSKIPVNVSQERVRVAATAVAIHMSEQGWGSTYTAAEALQSQIRAARRILSASSVERAYCSRDFFGVITHAADVDVDDVTRELTLSESGAIVLSWLAVKAQILSGDAPGPLIDIESLGTTSATSPLDDPSDGDFAEACEQLYQLFELGEEETPEDESEGGDEDQDEYDQPDGNGAYFGRAGAHRHASALRLKPSMFPGQRSEARM